MAPKLPPDVVAFMKANGAKGGRSRATKHTKQQLAEWGKKGGRPKGSTKRSNGSGE